MVFKVQCEQSTTLNDTFKATAGRMLASGLPFQEVENQKNLMIVTIVTSRKKYLEEKQKNNLH